MTAEAGVIIGVDPGKSGGVAMIDAGGRLVSGRRMPILKHGKRDLVDTAALYDWVDARQVDTIVLEQVSAMPGQGSVSGFNFGRHTGSVEGWALSNGCAVHWVTPGKWKKHFNLSSDKRASLDRARLEFGEDPRWQVLANDGIAEAGLIALWYLTTRGNW